jgi:hypothetical protein
MVLRMALLMVLPMLPLMTLLMLLLISRNHQQVLKTLSLKPKSTK